MAVWSSVNISQLPNFRFDAEYYQPNYVELSQQLAKVNPLPIGEFAFVTDGIHASPEWVEEDGMRYFSAKSVKDNEIILHTAGQISIEQHRANPRTEAQVNDVLLTTVGTIGNAAVVDEDVLPANMDRHLGIIRIRGVDYVDPYYLATFLNSKYGVFQSIRESTGNVQLNLFIDKIKKIQVPVGEQFNRVGDLARQAYELRRQSKLIYQVAEDLLLEELGLKNIDVQSHSNYVALFSMASKSRRLDAEYFQPKYQITFEILGEHGMKLGDVAVLAKRRFQPTPLEYFNYIEISDLTDDGRAESNIVLGENAPSRAQQILKPDDIITSTVRPIRKLTALISSNQEGFVCSSGFAVLKPQSIDPEVLFVYLRLNIICELLHLLTTATMYPAVSPNDLMNLPIKLPSPRVSHEIVDKVRASQQLVLDAKILLQQATSNIEDLIERGF